jgi:hypothetical protein
MIGIPDQFICPFTLKVFDIPMVTRTGYHFEQQAICRWLEEHNQCPLSHSPLSLDDMIVDRGLMYTIRVWKKHGHGKQDQPEDKNDDGYDAETDDCDDVDKYMSDFYTNMFTGRPFLACLKPTREVTRALVEAQKKKENHPITKMLAEMFKHARKERKRGHSDFFQQASTAA